MPAALPLNRVSAPLNSHNAVLHARSRRHVVKDFAGPLSIKSVTFGTVAWKSGGRDLVVDRDSFLVLQDGEPYSMDIDCREPVSTLCVFFERGFAEAVAASLGSRELQGEPALPFSPGHLHTRDDRILPRMNCIAQRADGGRLWLDEQFLLLARDLSLLDRAVRRRVMGMPARRASTREELMRRVRRGQEVLHTDPCGDVTLAGLARESCLSPFHFHRAFTQAFGRTPHQYRNELRLSRARRLLESTALTVTEVSGVVGFESAPSFATLYRRTFGMSPAATRKFRKLR
jgi:AraC family transcriptional regulator